ncbi:diacylglycerol kinase family protein [Phocicoccus pinnipedialis]|uniref:Undecaprenol kinase n=1 Tax=Phocicoccus pinnipedialis TaxID=110845 RepID=A0A6V7RE50_9BACL|nr:diacylglycerol kinase family protein [Jeotgalicoccus pinnipedialis]MBP1939270.1 undecaprenol kinase [Jeotgalicoccus pinnipedialis]CAD2076081.1 Undecaprenol kinase [Jeotgalicoccus pinnipedialis]
MKRLKHPFEGLYYIITKDYHFVAHLLTSIVVIMFGFMLNLNGIEWLFIFSAIIVVLILEALNTALEETIDLVTKEYHPLAKHVKDISALAVLLACIYAVVVGVMVFIPKIIGLFN